MKTEIYRVEIPVTVDAKYEDTLKRLSSALKDVDKAAADAAKSADKQTKSSERDSKAKKDAATEAKKLAEETKKATDANTKSGEAAERNARKLTMNAEAAKRLGEAQRKASGESVKANEQAIRSAERLAAFNERNARAAARVQRASKPQLNAGQRMLKQIDGMRSSVTRLNDMQVRMRVSLVDRATGGLNKIKGSVAAIRSHPVVRITVSVIDRTMRTLGAIKQSLISIPTAITVGVGFVAGKAAGEATVGAAANWERYEVAMNHWLDGNQKEAKNLTTWMGQFADSTPFSSPELFPALTTAVSMADKNIDKAKRLTKIAADMSALTPGTTPEDAMNAIFAASMGNTVQLKGYGMNVGKKDIAGMGGFDGLVNELETTFDGGAAALAKTASGIWSTLQGYRGSFMRAIGTGMLDPIKPRLSAVSDWLDNNQDKWGKWKSVASNAGRDATEAVLGSFEGLFTHIKDNYLESDKFMEMNLGEKIKFITDDINRVLDDKVFPAVRDWWEGSGKPFVIDIGVEIGSMLAKGIALGVKEGVSGIGGLWGKTGEDIKEHGLFSSEAMGSGATAAAVTTGAALIGGKIVKGIVKPIASAVTVTTKGVGKLKDVAGKMSDNLKGSKVPKVTPPVVATVRTPETIKPGRVPSLPSASDGYAHRTKGLPVAPGPSPYRSIKPPSAPAPVAPPRVIPQVAEAAPKGGIKGLLKKVPVLGTVLTAGTLATTTKDTVGQDVTGLAGSLAGAKLGAAAGTAVMPGVGTVVGGVAGSVAGGLGGGALGSSLEDSLFSASWWQEKWEKTKGWAAEAWSDTKNIWDKATEPIKETLFNSSWWSDKWDDTKNWASEAWSDTKDTWNKAVEPIEETLFNSSWWKGKWEETKNWTSEKWSDTKGIWNNVLDSVSSTVFSASWWAYKAGYVLGVLETTLFSAAWWNEKWTNVKNWTSRKWDSFKEIWATITDPIAETLFNTEWWGAKWDNIKSWTKVKWEGFKEIWATITEPIAETLFNLEWWGAKWDSVKSWTNEKWMSFVEVWDSVMESIANTIFNTEWWGAKWDSVKAWTSEKWDGFIEVWDAALEGIANTLFNVEWWSAKWEAVREWTSEKWASFTSIWESVKDTISSTLFDPSWWSGKWAEVGNWARSAWDSISSGFTIGREAGRSAGGGKASKYANGGFISKPHLGLVGEAGPEVIIPLSAQRRDRALELYNQAGSMLGVQPYADGGLVGSSISVPSNNMTTTTNNGGAQNNTLQSGGITVQIDEVNIGNKDNPVDIDAIAMALATKIKESLNNRGVVTT